MFSNNSTCSLSVTPPPTTTLTPDSLPTRKVNPSLIDDPTFQKCCTKKNVVLEISLL